MSDFPTIIEVLSDHYKYWEYSIGYTDIKLSGLPLSINVDGNHLARKDEFHITTVNVRKIAELIDPARVPDLMAEIVEEFKKFLKEVSKLEEFKLSRDFRFVRRGDSEMTVVVLCDIIGAPRFFDRLGKKFNKLLPIQPFHITLYTLNSKFGIGILSDDVLNQISRPIELPELKNLKPA